ncbi:glycosyltransferase [Janibacter sp. G349]|uniref:glycosyltransferase n=1 Tax=Janibacter sp. G349 TaxID=3405424 RepID=UPI003B783A0E
MRVVHAIRSDGFAGVETHVARLAAAQRDEGHHVAVIGGDPNLMARAVDRQDIPLLPARTTLEVMRHLRRLVSGVGPTIIHTHMTAAEAAAVLSWPVTRDVPIVTTRHFAATRGNTVAGRIASHAIAHRVAAQIAVSEYISAVVDGDSTVILPGIPDRSMPLPPSQRDRVVLVAQRLEAEKATEVALSAFAQSGLSSRGWRLLIAGEGSLRDALSATSARLDIQSSVDLLGRRNDVDALMARSGLFLATATSEPMGLSVVEAMASGLPVVASAAGGHLESVGGADGAALFAPGDARTAGELLAQLADDPELRDTYGSALRARQRETFSITAQVSATDEVYRHALAARSGAAREADPTGRHLVVISLEPWDRVWRRNQHLVHGLLQQDPDLRVLFVEPGRDPLHTARLGGRPAPGRGLRRGPHLPGIDPDALWLLEPTKLLPRRVDPGQDDRWARQVADTARQLGMPAPTLWVNDPRGALVMDRTGWPTLYDITDDWLLADRDAATSARLAAQEAALMEGAREVVVCSTGLVTSKSAQREVTLVPNAVDLAATTRPTARPDDLPAGPVALYLGTLHSDRLDVALCEGTARALEGTGHLVLVGPDALTSDEGDRLDAAGVVRLGAKDRRVVPAYLQHADVLVVPHVVDGFTDSLDPIKLYEYRAVGRPVVSTPVAGFREAAGERCRVVPAEAFAAEVARWLPASDSFPHRADPDVPTWADRVNEMADVIGRVSGHDEAGQAQIPIDIRTLFGHAAIQRVADLHHLDVLHIKGDALDPALTHPDRLATDADVLVRPDHVDALVAACIAAGYRAEGRFSTSSPFEHSQTLWHEQWGYLDVHRHYPGIGLPPGKAFDHLWAERGSHTLAAVECPVPSLAAQAAVLVMHAGRNPHGGQVAADVEHVWHRVDAARQREILDEVDRLHAQIAFAAGTGDLDALPPSAEKELWRAVTHHGRLREWRARIAAAPSRRQRLQLLLRAPLVNTDHLAKQLGHRPSRREVAVAFVDRSRRGLVEMWRRGGAQ